MLTGGCASFRPPSALPEPPAADAPPLAAQPCRLPRLPEAGVVTWKDLERAYLERGAAIVACDQARALAVTALADQQAATRDWLAEVERLWPK